MGLSLGGLQTASQSIADTLADLVGQDIVARSITLSQASGSDAVAFQVDGARLHLGTGTTDYLSSNGTTISAAGAFAVGTTLNTGTGTMTVPGVTTAFTHTAANIYFNNAASLGSISSAISAATAGATAATAMLRIYPDNALDATDWLLSLGTAGNAASVFSCDYSGNVAALALTLSQASGSNGLTFSTAGARLKLSAGGTSDYLTSDGTNTLTAAGIFAATTFINVASNGYQIGGAYSFLSGSAAGLTSGGSVVRGNVANAAASIATAIGNSPALTASGATLCAFYSDNFTTRVGDISKDGKLTMQSTDSSGSPGAATINQPNGRSAIAAGASSVVITNSVVSAASHVFISPVARDATGLLPLVTTVGAGSFTVSVTANCTAALTFDWVVFS